MLLGVFLNAQDLLQLDTQDAVLLGLVGTTVFGSAIRCRVPLLEITRTAFTLVIVLITFQKATSWE